MPDEFDIESLWADEQPAADDYYRAQVSPQLHDLVQRQSNSALNRLKRIMIWEWVVGLALLPVGWWQLSDMPYVHWFMLGLVGYLFCSIPPYWSAWRAIDRIPTQNIQESLVGYQRIVRQFRRRVRGYVLVVTPLSFFVGLFFGGGAALLRAPWWSWLLAVGIAGLLTWFLDWMMRKAYFAYTYDRILERLENLREQLSPQ